MRLPVSDRVSQRFWEIVFPAARAADGADQWARVVMNEHVEARLSRLPSERLTALEFSGENHRGRPWAEYRSARWPDHDICDLASTALEPADVVIAEQVLEHVPRPWDAVANMARLCRPGGLVVVTVPFLLRRHEEPGDYWRFTEDGLKVLFEQASLEVEDAQSWGNRQCVVGNLCTWARHRRWYSLRNERPYPVVTWAFGRPRQ